MDGSNIEINNNSKNETLLHIIKDEGFNNLNKVKMAFNMLSKKAFCCKKAMELNNQD